MAEKVGFIGLGTMGRPFAKNLVGAGFDLIVYDVRPEPIEELRGLGARTAASAREVAEQADIIDIAVPHESEVDAVLHGPNGLLAGARPGGAVVIHSSLHPNNMKQVGEEVSSHKLDFLDAQMSGGDRGVMAKDLLFMVGGDKAVFERCRPILETTGKNIFHLGPVGAGALAKVAQNTMTAMTLMVATEGFRFARAAGIDPEIFEDLIRVSSAQSHIADDFVAHWEPRDLRWQYYEVLENALQLGRQLDVPLPTAALCQQLLANALRK
jgi:3-hydroxyisobutyrate dehydrogenase-like beta-hydroxyacid dehydrogenase